MGKLLKAKQAAEYLGLRVQRLYDKGFVGPDYVLVGGEKRYTIELLDKWIENQTVGSTHAETGSDTGTSKSRTKTKRGYLDESLLPRFRAKAQVNGDA